MGRLSFIIPVLVTLAIAVGVYRVSYEFFQSQELSSSQGRLSLYQSSVIAELERFSHLTHVLSRDASVIETASGGLPDELNTRLEDFAQKAGLDAIYLMTIDGLTISASNHREPGSFVGQNYAFRPYFQDAMAGKQGRFYAIGATTGLPGYFIADAVRMPGSEIIGVVALKIGFASLEESWRNSGEQVFLANEDGVIVLSSDQEWRYRVLAPLSYDQRKRIKDARQFQGQSLAPLEWSNPHNNYARIAGTKRYHLNAEIPPLDWTLHYFAPDDRVVARSWLVTGLVVFAAGLSFIFYQIQRARRIGAALALSEQEEASLRMANERLAAEIRERETAERRLKRTQGELERSSRLAALGKLAASVTHELGQPIAAMRNHLVAMEIKSNGQAGSTGVIGGLVDRMEGITRRLKFFATSETEAFVDVDLNHAMRASVALLEPNLTSADVRLFLDLSDHAVYVRGIRLKIEQVMTNLLRNAVDASVDETQPVIHVRTGATHKVVWFEIEDNGHGMGETALADLQEPFVTTRESGQGMGLGLSISASIVDDHNGHMSARNVDTGGAVFRVSFPVPTTDEVEL